VQKRSEETRKRILEVALTCFAEKGYEATGVAEICLAAKVSKGAFYHHFSTKQAIFMALLTGWLAELDARLFTEHAPGRTIPMVLADMADMAGGVFSSASGQLPLFLEFLMQAKRDPEIWYATIEPYRHYRDLFAGLIKTGIAEGSLKPVSADRAAKVFVSMAVGLLLQSVLDPEAGDWALVAKEGVELFINGIRSKET
jgi:AcrR family transcriptional regulator